MNRGAHVGYNGVGGPFERSPVGGPARLDDWADTAWLVARRDLDEALVKEHAIVLAETLVSPAERPHARRWLAEQPLVCVSGLKADTLVEGGTRVVRVAHAADGDMLEIEARGGARPWHYSTPLSALPRAGSSAQSPALFDRLLDALSEGTLREASVVNALAARKLIEPGYGYRGAPAGTLATLEELDEPLALLDALFGPVFAKAAADAEAARVLREHIEPWPDDAGDTLEVPGHGVVRRSIDDAVTLDGEAATWTVDGEPQRPLVLPARQRLHVAPSDPFVPEVPDALLEPRRAPRSSLGLLLLIAVLVLFAALALARL